MKRFRGVIIVVLLLAAWLTTEWLLQRRTVPPASVTDFPTFAEWQQSPRDIEVIQQGGSEYLFVMGRSGGVLPSGPSGYVFDRSGRLLDWTSDVGDDPRFRDKWLPSSQRSGPHLDVDGAREWINGGGTITDQRSAGAAGRRLVTAPRASSPRSRKSCSSGPIAFESRGASRGPR